MATCDVCCSNRSSRMIEGIYFCGVCFDHLVELRSGKVEGTTYFNSLFAKSTPKAQAYISKTVNADRDRAERQAQKAKEQAMAAQALLIKRERTEAEERDRQELQNIYAEVQQISMRERFLCNDLYEYKTEYLYDAGNGILSKDLLDSTLFKYASQGWHLKTAMVNEAGKNGVSIAGIDINATMDMTILIFERCIRRASNTVHDQE